MWVTAAGNPEHVKKGSQAMLWAVIGIFIIFASYAILTLVFKAMGTTGTGYNPWGVAGYTKSDLEKAEKGCYCTEIGTKETKTEGAKSPTKIFQPFMEEADCNQSGEKNPGGYILDECEWQEFQTKNTISTP
jgi:hypothetical protein